MIACEGDCDADSNCAGALKCFQRNDKRKIPGCKTGSGDRNGWDYCYNPDTAAVHVDQPLQAIHGNAHRLSNNGRMRECEGDCDRDSNCASGLKCFQRNDKRAITGCNSGGSGDVNGWDYCYIPKPYCNNGYRPIKNKARQLPRPSPDLFQFPSTAIPLGTHSSV